MDKQRILSLLDMLETYVGELRKGLPADFLAYKKNLEKKRFCERTLQLAIEVCLDISYMLLKELRLGVPANEETVFDKLKDAQIFSEQLSEKLSKMKKFRNVLIHRYVQIEDHLVYEHALHEQDDFKQFKKEVLTFLLKKNGKKRSIARKKII